MRNAERVEWLINDVLKVYPNLFNSTFVRFPWCLDLWHVRCLICIKKDYFWLTHFWKLSLPFKFYMFRYEPHLWAHNFLELSGRQLNQIRNERITKKHLPEKAGAMQQINQAPQGKVNRGNIFWPTQYLPLLSSSFFLKNGNVNLLRRRCIFHKNTLQSKG